MTVPPRIRPPGCVTDLVFDAWFAGELEDELEHTVVAHTTRCPRCHGRHAVLAAEREAFLARRPSYTASPQQLARRHKHWLLAALLLMAAALVGLATLAHEDASLPKAAARAS
jgi:anti-sigma factor RsiW